MLREKLCDNEKKKEYRRRREAEDIKRGKKVGRGGGGEIA